MFDIPINIGRSMANPYYLYTRYVEVWGGEIIESWNKSKTINTTHFKEFDLLQRKILYNMCGKEFREKYMSDEDRIHFFTEL